MATVTDREQMRETILAGKVLTGISISICGILFLLNLAGLFERMMHVGLSGLFQTTIRKSFVALFMFCLVGTTTIALHVVMVHHNFTANEEDTCNNIVGALVGLFVSSKQFLFMFLFFRAKIVHEALRLNSFRMIWLRRLIWITITVGIPVAFGWTYFLVFFGKVVPEGACILYSEIQASIIAFAVSDVVLSSTLLALFVVPIREHSKQLGLRRDPKLDKVIRRNMVVAGLVICTTLTGLISMVVFLNIAHGKNVPSNVEYLQLMATLLPLCELTFTLATAHMLTRAWMPSRVRKYLQVTPEDHITSKVSGENRTVPSSAASPMSRPESHKDLPVQSLVSSQHDESRRASSADSAVDSRKQRKVVDVMESVNSHGS